MVLGVRCPVILGIRNPGPDHHPSRLLVQKALVLLILCILCIDVNYEKNRFPALPARYHRTNLMGASIAAGIAHRR